MTQGKGCVWEQNPRKGKGESQGGMADIGPLQAAREELAVTKSWWDSGKGGQQPAKQAALRSGTQLSDNTQCQFTRDHEGDEVRGLVL